MRTRRTYVARITNHSQVRDPLDSAGFAASKLWNVGRYYTQQQWDLDGKIPDPNGELESELKSELKGTERYTDLHSQSSQRVLEELAEAFRSFFGLRRNGHDDAQPPHYRKHGDSHPRSTVTWKQKAIKHDTKNGRLRLAKGRNFKEHRFDFILCEYETRPDVEVENIQQVRAVFDKSTDRWELHIVCRKDIHPESPGDATAGIDLGICNYLAIAFDGEASLYPGNTLKEDKHYFKRQEYETEGDNGPSRKSRWAKRMSSRRADHFLHSLSKAIVEECVSRSVGTIAVGDLTDIRKDANWGRHGNKRIHGWEFARFTDLLDYKARERGVELENVSERDTSKTCSVCGTKADRQRVERGLYVCETCDTVANADVNGARNIRSTITPSPSEDRSNGWLAQPVVRLFDRTRGAFLPREQATTNPNIPTR